MCARQSPGQKIKQKQYQSTDCCSIFYEPIQIREDTRLQPGWLLLSSISVCYRAPPRTINRHGIASRHERHRSRGNQGGFHCTHAHAQTKTKNSRSHHTTAASTICSLLSPCSFLATNLGNHLFFLSSLHAYNTPSLCLLSTPFKSAPYSEGISNWLPNRVEYNVQSTITTKTETAKGTQAKIEYTETRKGSETTTYTGKGPKIN